MTIPLKTVEDAKGRPWFMAVLLCANAVLNYIRVTSVMREPHWLNWFGACVLSVVTCIYIWRGRGYRDDGL